MTSGLTFRSYFKQPRARSIWMYLIASLFFVQFAYADTGGLEIQVTLSANPVLEYETFTLIVSANQRLPNTAFQPEQFLRDFRIRGTSVNSSSRIVNNESQHTTEWRVTLTAPAVGNYQIPSLTVNGVRTQPIDFEVIPRQETDDEQADYFLKTEIESERPYVQQQVRLTVRLFMAATIESGSLELPELEHFHVEQLGQDRQSQDIVEGRRYQVLTRTYLLTPRRSGTFTIEPVRFEGMARIIPSGSFTTFGRLESVRALGEAITVEVRSRPDAFEGAWLPSEFVMLEEQWDPSESLWTMGEPITRTITLTAAGVRREQLPDLTFDYPAEIRTYPDRGQTDTRMLRGQPVARVTYTTALIPAQAGEFVIPAIRVPWWNVQKDQLEYAELPERTVRVIAPPGGVLPPGSMDVDALESHRPSAPSSAESADEVRPAEHSTSRWQILAAVLFIMWFATLGTLLWFIRANRLNTTQRSKRPQPQTPEGARAALQAIKSACRKNDANACAQALREWHYARTGRPATSLPMIGTAVPSAELTALLERLESSLFNPVDTSWNEGKALWEHLTSLHLTRQQAGEDGVPPLYPE